ncbi:ABC transporter substrate-binding protein [Niallia sp. 01092]|uniref:ABC transporter substrate-binding protein n=1 Tax=unclassified Niallia TaxID=2837522 RepID=UPI003FD27BCD
MKKKIMPIIATIALAAGVLAGCSNDSTKTSATGKETKNELSDVTLRVAETGWGTYQNALKEAGLDDTPYKVQYNVFQGGNLILEAMNAGHVDLGTSSEIPPIFSSLSQNGDNSKVIAIIQSSTLNQELVVPQGSSIKDVSELKGKKVGYVNNTTAHYFLIKMLESAGLTWNDIKPVPLTTSDGLAALLGKNIDALASYGNAIVSARQQHAKTIASAKDILSGNFQVNASVEAIKDPGKHAAIIDYLDRLNKAYEWERNNKEEWAEIVAKNTKQPVEQALQILKEGEEQRPSTVIPLSEANTDSQQDIVETFKKVGLIKENIDVSSFWNHDFDQELTDELSKN